MKNISISHFFSSVGIIAAFMGLPTTYTASARPQNIRTLPAASKSNTPPSTDSTNKRIGDPHNRNTNRQRSASSEKDEQNRELQSERVNLPGKLDTDLDRLIRTWLNGYVSRPATGADKKKLPPCREGESVATPDSVYIERLSRLPAVVSLTFNPVVKECIELYVNRRRTLLRSMLTLGDLYFPMIEDALDRYKLPLELKYLTIVESGLNPSAVSPAGASGLWQFMLSTGKSYGLTANSLVDERFDPEKSTDAACRYLRDMYRVYDDWLLVMAAYNCGPGNVNRAIRQAGGVGDFWKIYTFLPRETRSYIPLFMAAYYAVTYHREHNICPREMVIPLATDTVIINKPLTFDRLSRVSGVSKDVIRLLNPQFKKEIIPGNIRPYAVKVPMRAASALNMEQDSLYSPSLDMKLVEPTAIAAGASKYHTVRRGDTLGKIAKKYGCSVANLRQMNGKRVNKLKPGIRIKVRR